MAGSLIGGSGRGGHLEPVRGLKASGAGGHFGMPANLETFCDLQRVTVRAEIERYPF
ncbi:hypothetical protein RCO28_20915 [Streptomyces sp. LHD-70]|uniref:hypothetical protein n=1 Tax=Streptomyces sp. LHD-70 TaxID=3072140 RepID=UPI00280E6A8E|nr:hypothetical protein [Streptomyces sp. LHD-70]MDQ8704935.1 hypothetical protein [Streptomyces sp. LHD-70]